MPLAVPPAPVLTCVLGVIAAQCGAVRRSAVCPFRALAVAMDKPTVQIRATHPYGFRSGEWARLAGSASLPGFPEGNRNCYLVEFPDGVTDFWAIDATEYGYEFRKEPTP